MPWTVNQRDGRWCVLKSADGSVVACHDTEAEAEAQVRALYAGEPASKADLEADDTLVYVGESVKAMGDGRVGGLLAPFGSESDLDRHGDYFTPDTDFGLDVADRARVIYHHGFTKAFGRRRLGVVRMGIEPGLGVVAIEPARLDMADPAQRDLYAKAERGEMFWSTGTAPHLMARDAPAGRARRILEWPISEVSLTPRPANPRAAALALKAIIDDDAGPAAPAGDRLLDDLTRAASDAERLRGLCESSYKSRIAEGRTLSREKRDAIRAVRDAYAALHAATAPARVDPEEFRALLARARGALHPARRK